MTLRISRVDLIGNRLVLDASVAINILGTGICLDILNAIPCDVIMERQAYEELTRHPISDRDLNSELDTWSRDHLVEVVSLTDTMVNTFDELTQNSFGTSFGRGEAATMAYVIGSGEHSIPVIDEKKATRFFENRWQDRLILNTLVLLRCLEGTGRLPTSDIRTAVLSALRHARMQVPENSRQWVIDLLGPRDAGRHKALKRHLPFG